MKNIAIYVLRIRTYSKKILISSQMEKYFREISIPCFVKIDSCLFTMQD